MFSLLKVYSLHHQGIALRRWGRVRNDPLHSPLHPLLALVTASVPFHFYTVFVYKNDVGVRSLAFNVGGRLPLAAGALIPELVVGSTLASGPRWSSPADIRDGMIGRRTVPRLQ